MKNDEQEVEPTNTDEEVIPLDDTSKYDSVLKDYQYLTAEFINYKKRVESENLLLKARVQDLTLLSYLNILDHINLAIDHNSSPEFEKILREILNFSLTTLKVESFGEVGDLFDPNKHEALSTSQGEPDQISKVFQKGYRVKDRIIRSALVEVSV